MSHVPITGRLWEGVLALSFRDHGGILSESTIRENTRDGADDVFVPDWLARVLRDASEALLNDWQGELRRHG